MAWLVRTLSLLCIGVVVPVDAGAVDLLAHRAVYKMTLERVERSSDVIGADGLMLYSFARECSGWTVENRTYLNLAYESGNEADTQWTFASWEAFDGVAFRFHARYEQNGRMIDRIEGKASLKNKGDTGTVRFSRPDDEERALPRGTLFPTDHMQQLIDAAAAGKTSLSRTVFDGASLDNPYTVNAIFGGLSSSETKLLASTAGLEDTPAWWIRMAFFPIASQSELPEFELGAHYRADGVADQIMQYFGDFTLRLSLEQLEKLPAPDC